MPQRPQLQPSAQAPQSVVAARPGNYLTALPGANSELAGLMSGLASFNPALHNLAQAHAQQEDRLDRLQGPEVTAQAKATAERDADPVASLYKPTPDVPLNVRPALAPEYLRDLSAGTAQRAGQRINAETLTAYDEAVKAPDFNIEAFLTERRSKALTGVKDSTAAAVLGSHLDNFEGQLRHDYERRRVQKLDEANNSILFQDAGDRFSTNLSADGIATEWSGFEARAVGLGKTPKEAAALAFQQIIANSNKLGGSPELFDAFDVKLADGTTMRSKNPELSSQVEAAKAHAVAVRDHRIEQENGIENGKTLDKWQRMIDGGEAHLVTPELLVPQFHKGGAIRSPEQFASILNAARDRAARDKAVTQFDGYADAGMLALLPDKVQGEIATRRLGPTMLEMADRIRQGDSAGASGLMGQAVKTVLQWGGDKPVAELTRFIEANLTTVPSASGPTPAFQAMQAMYKALAVAPALRGKYFDQDAQALMDEYTAQAGSGTDPKGAYEAAYRTIDPAAKKRAEEFAKSPEFQNLVKDKASKFVEGSSMWPTWLGGNGRPGNSAYLDAEAATQLRSMLARNPNLSDGQIKGQLEGWFKSNYVLDTTNQVAVKVPPGLGGADAQAAISEFTSRVAKSESLKERSEGTWGVQLMPVGTEGKYAAMLTLDGMPKRSLPGAMDLQTEIRRVAAKRVLTDDDKAQLNTYLTTFKKDGTVADIAPEVMAKGELMELVKGPALQAWKDKQSDIVKGRLFQVPKLGFGTSGTGPLQFTSGSSAVDLRSTADVASKFFADAAPGPYRGSDPRFMTASLVTMGEGLALSAYDDPARGAGKNIGMGYNLEANKATVNADLKAAGVSPERIESVKVGTLALTTDQAKRLLMVALPRFEEQTKRVAESTAPGLWDHMTAQQKAVMVDIAYQTGKPQDFSKAWAALKDRNEAGFAAETKTYFTNRSGERVEDTRRASLRDALLRGPTFWSQRLTEAGKLPGNKLQAMTLQ